ncbi:odorant receptor 131-2-like [Protopterus annectens]|uniref:odorant receptor 131-2-like n=1 Tax=Protopterus annectens TaxID=7888 RepID=UPI001CFBCA9D|nr:odorant receptor 131-2-like [Protopterus annectens]
MTAYQQLKVSKFIYCTLTAAIDRVTTKTDIKCQFVRCLIGKQHIEALFDSLAVNGETTYTIEVNWIVHMKMAFILTMSSCFIFINCIQLYTFFQNHVFRETPRYILFAHMLLNDTIHIIFTVLLYLLVINFQQISKGFCTLIVILSGSTFFNTPLNLTAMATERYIAICLPFRHIEICTVRRISFLIWVIWILGLLNFLIDLLEILATRPMIFFMANVYCARDMLIMTAWQTNVRITLTGVYFSSITIVILYTYIEIMRQTRSTRSDSGTSASASKASKTIVLHAIQLGLCMMSLFSPLTERLISTIDQITANHVRYFNYCALNIFPKCPSPLIYGLRDETFRKAFMCYFMFAKK